MNPALAELVRMLARAAVSDHLRALQHELNDVMNDLEGEAGSSHGRRAIAGALKLTGLPNRGNAKQGADA